MKKNNKSQEELLQEINKKLDRLIGILAIQNKENDNEKIKILTTLGFESNEIAKLLGLTPNVVRVRKFRVKS